MIRILYPGRGGVPSRHPKRNNPVSRHGTLCFGNACRRDRRRNAAVPGRSRKMTHRDVVCGRTRRKILRKRDCAPCAGDKSGPRQIPASGVSPLDTKIRAFKITRLSLHHPYAASLTLLIDVSAREFLVAPQPFSPNHAGGQDYAAKANTLRTFSLCPDFSGGMLFRPTGGRQFPPSGRIRISSRGVGQYSWRDQRSGGRAPSRCRSSHP